VVICLERGAELHMFQLMPLSLTVSCFSKIQIGFAFLVPAHLGGPGERAFKRVCVCVLELLVIGFDYSLFFTCALCVLMLAFICVHRSSQSAFSAIGHSQYYIIDTSCLVQYIITH